YAYVLGLGVNLIGGEQGIDDLSQELIHLLGRAAHEPPRLECGLEIANRDAELAVGGEAVEEVVSLRAVLERARRLDAMLTDAFVRDLAVDARVDRAHDQLFGGHERQLVGEAAADPRGVHLEPARHILHQDENRVGSEKALGNYETPVGAVVECSLEELR